MGMYCALLPTGPFLPILSGLYVCYFLITAVFSCYDSLNLCLLAGILCGNYQVKLQLFLS